MSPQLSLSSPRLPTPLGPTAQLLIRRKEAQQLAWHNLSTRMVTTDITQGRAVRSKSALLEKARS